METTKFDCFCGKDLNKYDLDLGTYNHMKSCSVAQDKFQLLTKLRELQDDDNFELMKKKNFRLMSYLIVAAMEIDEMWFEGMYLKKKFEQACSQPQS